MDSPSFSDSDLPLVHVVGGGLAGVEAAHAAVRLGCRVRLFEMRPTQMTPAHRTGKLGELVCSNSLGGESKTNGKGLLQHELRCAGSVVMAAADEARVPAGGALAVDRERFSESLTRATAECGLIERVEKEVAQLPEAVPTVLASGPLTSEALSNTLRETLGRDFLSYYDAAAPVILADSIDREICYKAGRYGQEGDYWNCPLSQEDWQDLHQRIAEARTHTPHDWENLSFFEGCMPIEELARRGYQTPLFGPLKPVGLPDPRSGREPFAVVQLRREDSEGRMLGLVGFQTGLAWGEQKDIVHRIPGLEHAEIVRYGVMHRNTYLNMPELGEEGLELKSLPGTFAAGVLAGVEGYLESAATGWFAGRAAAQRAHGRGQSLPPETSMLGGLLRFLAGANPDKFQPMNANWGLVPSPKIRGPKRVRRAAMFEQGARDFEAWISESQGLPSRERVNEEC